MQRLSSIGMLVLSLGVTAILSITTTVNGQTGIFKRGDSNADSAVDITDSIYTMQHLLTAGPPGPCNDAMDTDDDGSLTIADPLSSLFFLFGGHQEAAAPGLSCGVDPTSDSLRCFAYAPCGHSTQISERAGLLPADGCDDVLDQMRENLVNTMNRKLDENLQIALGTLANEGFCWPWL